MRITARVAAGDDRRRWCPGGARVVGGWSASRRFASGDLDAFPALARAGAAGARRQPSASRARRVATEWCLIALSIGVAAFGSGWRAALRHRRGLGDADASWRDASPAAPAAREQVLRRRDLRRHGRRAARWRCALLCLVRRQRHRRPGQCRPPHHRARLRPRLVDCSTSTSSTAWSTASAARRGGFSAAVPPHAERVRAELRAGHGRGHRAAGGSSYMLFNRGS